jgi:hypothetical protein
MVACSSPIIERPTLTGSEFPDIPPSIIHNPGDILTLPEFGEDIMSLLRFMSELAIGQSRLINTAGVTAEEIVTFNKLRAAAEHRLLSIRVIPSTNCPKNQLETVVYEACRLAALISSNCIFRHFTRNGPCFGA